MSAHRVLACAVCLGSAFGDRSYTWPYIGLILLPFVVCAAVLGVGAWYAGWRLRDVADRARVWRSAVLRRAAPDDPSPRSQTETP
jgi:hypothetical protein